MSFLIKETLPRVFDITVRIAIILAFLFAFNVTVALAQENGDAEEIDVRTRQDVRTEVRTQFREDVDAMREKREDIRTETETDVRARSEMQEERANVRDEFREDVDTMRAERAEERAAAQEERRAAIEERVKERIVAFAERIVRRLNAAAERLLRLADRMESRIEKLEARGFDLSVARGLLEAARLEIAGAQSDIDAILPAAELALDAETPRESFAAVREILNDAKESLKSAHRALVEAIREIKAGISVRSDDTGDDNDDDEDDTGTTTNETNE